MERSKELEKRENEFYDKFQQLTLTIRKHSLRVGVAAYLIIYANQFKGLEHLGLNEQGLKEAVINGGRFHDLGKIYLPPSLHRKDKKYSAQQLEIIHSHPVNTKKLLLEYADVLFKNEAEKQIAIEMGLHHHERWAGYGYPEGLAGENIPYISGICGFADDLDNEVYIPYTTRKVEPSVEKLIDKNFNKYGPKISNSIPPAMEMLCRMYENKNKCLVFIDNVLCGRYP